MKNTLCYTKRRTAGLTAFLLAFLLLFSHPDIP